MDAGVLAHHVGDEVAPDEATAAGDDYAAGLEGVGRVSPVQFGYVSV